MGEKKSDRWKTCMAECSHLARSFLSEELSGLVKCTVCGTSYDKTNGGPVIVREYASGSFTIFTSYLPESGEYE